MRIRINEQPASEDDIKRIIEFGAHEDDIDPRKRLLERLQKSCYLDKKNPKRPLNARERLLEQYRNDGLVLFLGAGVSVGSGIPTWTSLIQDVFRAINIDHDIAEQAAPSSIYARFELAALRSNGQKKFCDILYDSLYNQTGFKRLKKLLENIPRGNEEQNKWGKAKWNEILKELAKNETLRDVGDLLISRDSKKKEFVRNPLIHAVLNTNADNLLLIYCLAKTTGPEWCPITIVDRASVGDDPESISVYHLHGILDARDENVRRTDSPCDSRAEDFQQITDELLPRLVFRESEYFETIANPMSFVNHTPLSYFQRLNVLFIGTSLEDINIRRWLYSSFQERVQERTKYLQELHCKKYDTAKFEAKKESVRHFWLHPKKERKDGKEVEISCETVKLVELVMGELGVQVVWCDDLTDVQRCIRELKEKRRGA
jgi:plasmid stabilization system protein ParE